MVMLKLFVYLLLFFVVIFIIILLDSHHIYIISIFVFSGRWERRTSAVLKNTFDIQNVFSYICYKNSF